MRKESEIAFRKRTLRFEDDHGSLERSTAYVMRGCNEPPPRVERESTYWGLHTIVERIFPTDFVRGMETPRGSPLVRASFQRKGCFSTRRYAGNARSVFVSRVSQHCTRLSHRYVTMREKFNKDLSNDRCEKNEGIVSRIARISSHLRKPDIILWVCDHCRSIVCEN